MPIYDNEVRGRIADPIFTLPVREALQIGLTPQSVLRETHLPHSLPVPAEQAQQVESALINPNQETGDK